MKISMRGNASLLDSFDYAREIDCKLNVSRPVTITNAFKYVAENSNINYSEVQKFKVKTYERENIAENISIEVEDSLYETVKILISENFPGVRIQYPFICRMALTAYIMSMLNNKQVEVNELQELEVKKDNRNQNIQWIKQNGIKCAQRIIDNPDLRGIYGIFVDDKCVYIGRTASMYARIFMGDCHILNLRIKTHVSKLVDGFNNGKSINFKIIEEVTIIGDHPAKDAQRLASRECYWIDFYQAKEQCLEQYPEGRWMKY